MATAGFLSEFPPVRTEEWEKLIRETVAGPDYAARMIWHPEEGLAIRPYYRSEDIATLPHMDAAPGEFPFLRGARTTADWRICEQVQEKDPAEANRMARNAVSAGAEEIAFCQTGIHGVSDLVLLLSHLDSVFIYLEGASAQTLRIGAEWTKQGPHHPGLAADVDPLTDLEESEKLIAASVDGLKPFTIRAGAFHESGAGAIEELGFALSAGVDFVAEMRERGIALDRIVRSVGFSFAIGPEFFVQVAKLRAFRMIWAQAIQAFGGSQEDAKIPIRARTAQWNETVYDSHVNVLRATTEALAAVLGGADSIMVAPFDECYRTPDESSRRLARNTQLILKREALLSRVVDPLGGSYLVEVLTDAIAAKAWKLFQELESAGGFRKARAEGIVDSVLRQRASARELAVACRRVVLTGTNRFSNPSEAYPPAVEAVAKSIHPRAASALETVRFRTECHLKKRGRTIRILLAEIGDVKLRAARSQFASDFLACGGLSTQKQHFERVAEIASADADLIVLCSSDPEYLALAAELFPLMRENNQRAKIAVAGNPQSADQLRALGVTEFIHMRSNAVEVLSAIQQQIGIED